MRCLVTKTAIAGTIGLGENKLNGGSITKEEDRPMPPLIALAATLGGLVAVRWLYNTARRINQELEEVRTARVAEARTRDIPTLRRDSRTGAYRPD
jgi:hypothetical protein